MNFHAKQQPEGGLLQSPQWMNVVRAEGRMTTVVGERMVEQPHAIIMPLAGFDAYAYVPRIATMTEHVARALATLPYGWVRFDATDVAAVRMCARASGKRIVAAPHDMQPRHNLIVDLTPDPGVLLSAMKSKTRYNIRLAQKKGVIVRPLREPAEHTAFFALVDATARRKGVRFHDHAHYRAILTHLPHDMVTLYGAFYEDVLIAGNLVTLHNGTATYLHGATGDRHRDVMAPFLLQWQALCDAREQGCAWYDFGGVFPDATDAGKQGITRFKMGFAPRTPLCVTAGSYDMILSPIRYATYRAGQKVAHYFS